MNAERINVLRAGVSALTGRDLEFANSLLAQYDAKGRLSDRQWPWVDRMIERAQRGPDDREQEHVGDFSGVLSLLLRAKEHLKYPKIRLVDADGHPVVIGVAGERSRHPGTINVTDGGPYGANRWYGRVEADGTWTKGRAATLGVEGLLRRLGAAPEETAAEHGRLTGHCCFCNRHLEDERSTEVGYGPVCAKNFGLRWGTQPGAEHAHTHVRHRSRPPQ